MNDTTLGNWVRADRADRGEPDNSGLLPLTAEERAELTRLRRENARLKTEREILKKAAAFFVTESTRSRGSPSSTGRRPTTTSPRCAGCCRSAARGSTPGCAARPRP